MFSEISSKSVEIMERSEGGGRERQKERDLRG